jgi:hypothetical protein
MEMNPKDLTEFGRREAMSHSTHDNEEVLEVAQPTHTRKKIKYTEQRADRICELLKTGCTIEIACRAARISTRTFSRWKKDIPEFRERVEADEIFIEPMLLEKMIEHGITDWRALAWILERRFPSRWGAKQEVKLEVEKSNGTPEVLGMLQQVQAKLKTPISTQDTDEG